MRVWVHFSAARGPAECAWVVARLIPLFEAEAHQLGGEIRILEAIAGPESNTIRSALVGLSIDEPAALLASWMGPGWASGAPGTVQWIGQSPFRPKHKRKNWFVGLSALSPLTEARTLRRSDLKMEAIRASGPGGQHVNAVSTAVRLTHRPTGISVVAREERSQTLNRKLAEARLAAALRQQHHDAAADMQQQRWQQHDEIQRGDPVRVYRGERFQRRG